MTRAARRAVLFDLDGLLIDSEPSWRRAEIEVFATVGVALTYEQCAETTGLRIDELVRFRHAERPWTSPSCEVITERIVDRTIEAIEREGQPLPGALTAIDLARSTGARVAVVSSSPMRLIAATLRRLGVLDAFDLVASAEREPYGKPHPAVYLTAAASLHVAPTDCVAIEDSLNGVLAAKAARMRCVAVPESATDPRFAIADVRLRTLVDLDESALFAPA